MSTAGTYGWWVEHHKVLLAEADKFNAWAGEAKKALLTDIAPRLYALSQSGYWGWGFHYSKEQTFAALVSKLALPVQWSVGHCEKIPSERIGLIGIKVNYEIFIESIEEAEWSVGKTVEECCARDESKRQEREAKLNEPRTRPENEEAETGK